MAETEGFLAKPTTTFTTHHIEAKEPRGRASESTAAVPTRLESNQDHVHMDAPWRVQDPKTEALIDQTSLTTFSARNGSSPALVVCERPAHRPL